MIVIRVLIPRTYSTKNDRPRSRIEAQNKSGDSQPVTRRAPALPADPSRAETLTRIHHHGSEAPTVVNDVIKLRRTFFILFL
jgi:hypothetical protein